MIVKLILILFIGLPMIGFGQDLIRVSKCEIIINQVLENTVSYLNKNNQPKTEFRFYMCKKDHAIDWNKKRFYKWKIIEKTD